MSTGGATLCHAGSARPGITFNVAEPSGRSETFLPDAGAEPPKALKGLEAECGGETVVGRLLGRRGTNLHA